MRDRPILSIAIPTYQRPEQLAVLLDLLSRQQDVVPQDWEIFVSDNCSGDATRQTVESISRHFPRITYHCHPTNIGSERNFRSLYDRARGDYVWIIPDDDQVADDRTVSRVIGKLRSCPVPPAFMILNAKAVNIFTQKLVIDRFSPVTGDVYLTEGRDILSFASDLDLIGLQRLVVRRDIFPDPFIEEYMKAPDFITCMVISLAACARGPALVVGEPLAVFGDGDASPWRVYWPHIALQLLPEMLQRSVKELGYSRDLVDQILDKRRHYDFRKILPAGSGHVFVLQRHKLSWRRLARLYGWRFVIGTVIELLPETLAALMNPIKIARYIRQRVRS